MNRQSQPYSDPYLTGVGLGAVLLASYVLVGRGLGASGAFSSIIASVGALFLGKERASASPAIVPYLTNGAGRPLHDWIVLEVLGVALGGFPLPGLPGGFISASSGLAVTQNGPNRMGRHRRCTSWELAQKLARADAPAARRSPRSAALRRKLDIHCNMFCRRLSAGAVRQEVVAMIAPLTETGHIGAAGPSSLRRCWA